jgi:hypothetical protein
MDARILNIQFHPGRDSVAVLVETKLGQFFLNVRQRRLLKINGGGTWDEHDVLKAAKRQLKEERPDIADELTLVLPPVSSEMIEPLPEDVVAPAPGTPDAPPGALPAPPAVVSEPVEAPLVIE